MVSRHYDIVVFGSTGYTGKFVNEELYKLQKSGRHDLIWAAAGRSKAKLEKSLRGKACVGVNIHWLLVLACKTAIPLVPDRDK